MTHRATVTTTDMLSAARETFVNNGFTEVTLYNLAEVDSSNYDLFEDPYSLVAIIVFETWSDLFRGWSEAQASFVDLISEHISKDERKSWDCYLLLWTPDIVPPAQFQKRQSIRYDTGRVRKLIASGEEIRELADVEAALLPLLPITGNVSASTGESVLDRIPALLETKGLPRTTIRAVVDAFERQESLVESLHNDGGTL
jgi:hypothetical protein